MARCHRIGQTKVVRVFRLVCAGSYEKHMVKISMSKLGLSSSILGNINMGADGAASSTKMSKKEMEMLLKRGAIDIFQESDSSEGDFISLVCTSTTCTCRAYPSHNNRYDSLLPSFPYHLELKFTSARSSCRGNWRKPRGTIARRYSRAIGDDHCRPRERARGGRRRIDFLQSVLYDERW